MNQQQGQQQLQSQQMTREELTKTQVLNLQELERVAKFERKTSKRPALLFAIAGILSLTLGFSYNNIMMAVDSIDFSNASENAYRIDLDSQYDAATPVPTKKVTCTIMRPVQPDGTDRSNTYELYFSESKLQTYTKMLAIAPTAGSQDGALAAQTALSVYQQIAASKVTGYELKPETNNQSTIISVTVDLQKLDRGQLTYSHAANQFTNVEYNLNDDETTIVTALQTAGYSCTE
jgi:hypothetical protein